MNTYVQVTDITEIGELGYKTLPDQAYVPDYRRPVHYSASIAEAMRGTDATIKTELAFLHFPKHGATDGYYGEAYREAERLGFREVTRTLNWHSSHKGDHPMCLWMKQYPGNSPQPAKRFCYMTAGFAINGFNNIFAFGCGGRIVEDLDGLMLADPRGLTILRLPKEKRLTGAEKLWLQMRNYRLELLTSTGQVWINGWAPDKYSEPHEREFWKAFEQKDPTYFTLKEFRSELPPHQKHAGDDDEDLYEDEEVYDEEPEEDGDDE